MRSPSWERAISPPSPQVPTVFIAGATYGVFALVNGASLIPNHSALSGAFTQMYAYDYASASPHMRVFSGHLPLDVSAGTLPEVIVTPKSGLVPGDVITVSAPTFPTLTIAAQVVGVWYPRDEHDPYWNGQSFDSIDNSLLSKSRITFPLLFTKNALLAALAQYGELGNVSVHRLYFVHPTALNEQNASDVAENIARLRALLPLQLLASHDVHNAQIATHLDTLIRELETQSSLLSLPLYIIVIEIAGLGLLFTALAVNVMVEARGSAIAVLVSRGASKVQLLTAFVGPGALLAVLAALISPIIAAAFTLGVFQLAVPGVGLLDITKLLGAVSLEVLVAAVIVSLLLNIGVLSIAALEATRLNILAFRREQSRASVAPFWKRYYLDVALLLLGVIGYIEMSRLSSLPVRALLSGEQQIGQGPLSTLLLATPALLLPAGALLLMRLFPLVTRLGARRRTWARRGWFDWPGAYGRGNHTVRASCTAPDFRGESGILCTRLPIDIEPKCR